MSRLFGHLHVYAHNLNCDARTENKTGSDINQICAYDAFGHVILDKMQRMKMRPAHNLPNQRYGGDSWREACLFPKSDILFKTGQTAKSHQLIHFSLSTTNNMQVRDRKKRASNICLNSSIFFTDLRPCPCSHRCRHGPHGCQRPHGCQPLLPNNPLHQGDAYI